MHTICTHHGDLIYPFCSLGTAGTRTGRGQIKASVSEKSLNLNCGVVPTFCFLFVQFQQFRFRQPAHTIHRSMCTRAVVRRRRRGVEGTRVTDQRVVRRRRRGMEGTRVTDQRVVRRRRRGTKKPLEDGQLINCAEGGRWVTYLVRWLIN